MGRISRDGCTFVVNNRSVNDILNYLTMLHQGNLGYSSVNTAKSMLSSLFSLLHKRDIGKEPLIRHFMKGIFNLKHYQAM